MSDRSAPTQLIFDLVRAPSYDSDEFLVSPSNAQAHAMIEHWPDWPDRVLLLQGPAGSGKSHLGTMWAEHAGAHVVRPGDPLEPGTWPNPVTALVEDCDRAAFPEPALFHVLNLVKETSGSLLLTARTPPSQWNIGTADLLSRLRLAPIVAIGHPDGILLRAVLVKLFADRQIRIEEDIVAYAALHCDQSLDAISAFVAAVDEEALAAGRRITRPLAAQTLAKLTKENPSLED